MLSIGGDQSSTVDLYIEDYKSLRVAVMICAKHRRTDSFGPVIILTQPADKKAKIKNESYFHKK